MNRSRMVIIIIVASFCIISLLYFFTGTPDGSEIFKREGCINCHSFKGRGGSAGPDLTSITEIKDSHWIRNQIKNPKKHNPNSRMPEFRDLSWKEIQALIKYLKT
ncbi:MAG: cytochrome c [Nitrospirae bacterium]|nr:cytochrome c [Nitrospirota bacterium]